jgi:hypothetical protein
MIGVRGNLEILGGAVIGRIWQMMRTPKTANEKRRASDPFVPLARRAPRLPSSWDDIARICEKTWKAYRRTQYRVSVHP